MTTVSIVVPIHNDATTLDRVLRPLLPLPSGWDLIAVDDHSSDGTADLARSLGVRVVQSEVRGSDLAGRNRGARATSGEILVFIDADVVVDPDALRRAVQRLQEEQLGCVFGVYDRGAHLPGTVSRYKNYWIRHSTLQAPRPLRWMNSGLGIIRRTAFERVGGFREEYRQHLVYGGGDLDFGRRVAEACGPVVADGSFEVSHLKAFSLRRLWRNDRLRARGWLRSALAQEGLLAVARRPSLANVSAQFSLGVVAAALAALLAVSSVALPLAIPAAAALLLATALNGSFLASAARAGVRGWPLFVPLLWVDQLACATGLAAELAAFLLRPREGAARPSAATNPDVGKCGETPCFIGDPPAG